jgi:hypothetical protein
MNRLIASRKAVADFRMNVAATSLPGVRFYCVAMDGSSLPSTTSDDELVCWLNTAGGCAGFIALTGPKIFSIDPLCQFLQTAACGLADQA